MLSKRKHFLDLGYAHKWAKLLQYSRQTHYFSWTVEIIVTDHRPMGTLLVHVIWSAQSAYQQVECFTKIGAQ